MSQNGKLMPNLDQHSTKALNLTVLQRVDQFVEEILITAAHVTLYEFNIDLGQWSRKDVEGSLFVVKRNVQPRFQFIVMNRRNTENLVENLLGDFEYEIQAPYLLYRNASQEVNGIWFYNPQECDEVAKLFSRILSAYAKVPTKLSVPSGKSEFEELEAVPTNAVMDGPLEPSSVNTSDVTDIPSDHLLANFFGGTDREAVKNCFDKKKPPVYRKVVAAMNFGSGTSGTIIPPPSHPPSVPPAVPAAPMSASSNVFLENSSGHLSRTASLVKPSFFNTQPPPVTCSNIPTAPPLNPYAPNLQQQQSYGGTPIRQPFPPPTPSPALTPIPAVPTHTYGPLITRESVRKALLILAQDDQVIDKVHHALLNAHDS